jgi:hypothetical protein
MITVFLSKINHCNRSRVDRIMLLFTLFLFLSMKSLAQPSETVYPGTVIQSGYVDDASYGPLDIGFNFTFYGNTYSQFYVNSNGQVLFGEGSLTGADAPIPTADLPNNFIAAFWDDLVVDGTGKMLYTTIGAAPNRKLIIQCNNMGFYGAPAFMGSFSVILYETSNKIQVQFRLVVDNTSPRAHGSSASIGLENSDGTGGIQYLYHTAGDIHSGKAISFSPSGSTYTTNDDAIYEGIYLTTNTTLPEPGIPSLLSPPQNAVIGDNYNFSWSDAGNAASYSLLISNFSDLGGAAYYYAGSNLSYNVSGLILDTTYYWGVFATNATGTTWCEIKKFTTSSAPPLEAVPQTVWGEQGKENTIKLNYTGGEVSPKTAIITSLPAQGQLYQYVGGSKGSPINSVPATVTDASMNVIYSASGTYGNGVGNFNFKITDATAESEEATVTVNVSPPGVPNVLYIAKSTNVEIQFDIAMTDPTGKQDQFTVKVNDLPVPISSVNLKPGDNKTIQLILSATLSGSETVLVSYTPGDVRGGTGGYLLPFEDQLVTLKAQTIIFTQSLDLKYSDSPFTLTATASSGLGLTYSSSNLSVATVFSVNKLNLLALGTSVITAIQGGNATYAPVRYAKTLTVAKGDQTITFNPLPSKTVGDADFSPGATVTSGLTISYSSSNTSVATIVSSNIHIVAGGISVITASQAGNALYNAAAPKQQTLTVTDLTAKTLSLSSVLLEGLYNGSGTMRQAWNEAGPQWPAGVADHITVELHDATTYATIVYTASDVSLNIDGTATISVPTSYSGSYYITVKHRNSLETTTAAPVSFSGSVISQSFGSSADVYGGNLRISFDGRYLIYGGDVNQDGIVDTGDMNEVDNGSTSILFGYNAADANGDGIVDTSDMNIVDNNSTAIVIIILP